MSNLAVIPHFLLHYSLFNKVAGLPVNSVKFLRTSFFIEHLWWLLLFSVETVLRFTVFSECIFSVLGKNSPGKKSPDSKRNPVPNITLTLPFTPHGGLFSGFFFPETIFSNCLKHLKRFCCECEHTLF